MRRARSIWPGVILLTRCLRAYVAFLSPLLLARVNHMYASTTSVKIPPSVTVTRSGPLMVRLRLTDGFEFVLEQLTFALSPGRELANGYSGYSHYPTPISVTPGTENRAPCRHRDCNESVQLTKLKEFPEIGMTFSVRLREGPQSRQRLFVVPFVAPAQTESPRRNIGERFS